MSHRSLNGSSLTGNESLLKKADSSGKIKKAFLFTEAHKTICSLLKLLNKQLQTPNMSTHLLTQHERP